LTARLSAPCFFARPYGLELTKLNYSLDVRLGH
jgi:hypothetical protein